MYTQRNAITPQSHRNHNNIVMEIGTMLKYILIAVLILAGYYVVSSTAFKPREGFSLGSGSSETPAVTAKKSSDVLTDNTKSIVGFLQINDNRANYETLLEVMDAWTQAKIVASMNALSAQMNADSNDQSSTPSDKTVALMNSLVTMTNFQTTVVPAAFKYLDGTS
jgi:hypothetical protein